MCYKDEAELYAKAVNQFLATKQIQPKCCAITSTTVKDGVTEPPVVIGYRNAKMKVVTDMKNENYSRSFFVCPIKDMHKCKNEACNYFAWGDQSIVERPLCEHGKKEDPNKEPNNEN